MPEGLQYALSGKLSEGSRISLISYDEGPSLYVDTYIQEAVTNCLDIEAGKVHIHLVLFTYDGASFQIVEPRRTQDVTIYDFVRNPSVDLDSLYESIMKNVITKPGRAHILVVDDYSLLSILSSARDVLLQSDFLQSLSSHFRKMFLFFNKGTLSSDEMGLLCQMASDIVFLQLHPESSTASFVSEISSKFTCDLLKIRRDRRASHDRTVFQITKYGLQEKLLTNTDAKGGDSSNAEMLKNLTTFKLTLEEGERESKNKLHLPYFEAQKTTLEDPESFEDYEEDEEDEEV